MITTLGKRGHRDYEVKLLRNARSDPRDGDDLRVVYSDEFVRLCSVYNESNRMVGYRFRFRGSRVRADMPPFHESPFSVAVFYRRHSGEYEGRKFKVVYVDSYVRLLKFGREHPDYMFLVMCPPQEFRAGDKRFSTIANTHPIEEETMDIDLVIGDDNG